MQYLAIDDVLARASVEIDERGWCQGRRVRPDDGAVCIAGAIDAAIVHLWGQPRLRVDTLFALKPDEFSRLLAIRELALAAIADVIGTRLVVDWNDCFGVRTVTDVQDALEKARKLLAERDA